MSSTQKVRSSVWRAIMRFVNAEIADSWKGGGDPDDYDTVEAERKRAKTLLVERLQQLLRDSYLAGFNASGEGSNGEYPYGDKGKDPAADSSWKDCREVNLAQLFEEVRNV